VDSNGGFIAGDGRHLAAAVFKLRVAIRRAPQGGVSSYRYDCLFPTSRCVALDMADRPDQRELAREAKAIVAFALRNGPIKDAARRTLHHVSGKGRPFSDSTLVRAGG